MPRAVRYSHPMSVSLISISADTAVVALESLKIPKRVPASIAAKEARRVAERREKVDAGADVDDTASIIQSTEVALDLMTMGQRQPQASLNQALKLYEED